MSAGDFGRVSSGYSLATICLTFVLSFGTISAAWSADFQKGVDAAQSGDYATALREWKLLAKQGYVYAHMWGSIAATNGNELGAKLRDFVEKKMTAPQIAEAQDLASECVRKKYKDC